MPEKTPFRGVALEDAGIISGSVTLCLLFGSSSLADSNIAPIPFYDLQISYSGEA